MMARGAPVRSARKPPAGTETIDSQSTMLTTEPAATGDNPRSISMAGPKAGDMAKPALNQPHTIAARIRSASPCPRGQAAATPGAGAARPGGSRYTTVTSAKPKAASAALTRKTPRNPTPSASVGTVRSATARPTGQELTKIPMAVAVS